MQKDERVTKKTGTVKMRQGITYVSVNTCAELLDVSKSTVYQMLRAGRIEGAFQINRSWRIPVIEPRIKTKETEERQ